ncbi:SGNH/GDSL hydrolase family protein [Halostella sp. JP-L12]|uniref:SGNH/GDSL hydrolase family protein n=1 Tax=Halostella TaxID=1843185 RepID=UPI000EF7EC5B|nr:MULTISPECIES: SGNH/GDSL hydrolase family protein [Halostella]NHN46557.1 SGNH/GDSL hydrolase family protein [Halostella sp. JP-L12]
MTDDDSDGLFDVSEQNRDRLLNLALIFMSITVAFAGLEAGLRAGVVPYDRSVSSEDIHCSGPDDLHQFHPEYGWTLSPNATYLRHWKKPDGEDARYLYTTNSEGFRDTYDSGDRHVIVVGDSFTEGAGVTEGGQYTHLLDRWLPNTSFQTYAAGGYGTDQELLVYRNVSEQYDHDLVILAYYYGNDANNNAGNGWPQGPRRPRFELRNGSLVQTHEPVDQVPSDTAGFRDYGVIGAVHGTLRDHSMAYDWSYRRMRTVAAKAGLFGGGADDTPSPPTGEERRSQLQLTRALLDEMSTEASSHDADVLVVGIPARGEVTPDNPAHYPTDQGIPYYQDQRQMIQNAASNNSNLAYLDLKPRLEREIENGEQIYGQEVANAHFIADGYQVMAETIYQHISAAGYVPNRSVDYDEDYRQTVMSCPE